MKSCRRAMADGAASLVVERDLGQANANPEARVSDLAMLVGPGGRERAPEQDSAHFAGSGFQFVGFTPSAYWAGVFEGATA